VRFDHPKKWHVANVLLLSTAVCCSVFSLIRTVPLAQNSPIDPGLAINSSNPETTSSEHRRQQVEPDSPLARLIVSDGESDIDNVVSIVDEIANSHSSTFRAPALKRLIDETSEVYSGRDGYESRRLRAYALVKLSGPDSPDEALPIILDLLRNAPDALSRASAARAVGKIGERGKVALPFLNRLARMGAVPSIVSVDRFSQLDIPKEEWTTERVESVRAISQFDNFSEESISVLRGILLETTSEPLSRQLLVTAVQNSLDRAEVIRKLSERNDSSCSLGAVAGKWLQKDSRSMMLDSSLLFVNQSNTKVDASSLVGKPLVVAFFYVSCSNPERCARTVDAFRHIRNSLEERHLEKHVRLVLVSLEPVNDTPAALFKYGHSSGLPFDENSTMLRPIGDSMETMSRVFELPVSRCCNLVTSHSVPFFVLDHQGCLARRYAAIGDDLELILEDLERLLQERPTTMVHHDDVISETSATAFGRN
jgi:cytochrome oxidase Cu insertion factor (SCO1/SenC/PrrC family)